MIAYVLVYEHGDDTDVLGVFSALEVAQRGDHRIPSDATWVKDGDGVSFSPAYGRNYTIQPFEVQYVVAELPEATFKPVAFNLR